MRLPETELPNGNFMIHLVMPLRSNEFELLRLEDKGSGPFSAAMCFVEMRLIAKSLTGCPKCGWCLESLSDAPARKGDCLFTGLKLSNAQRYFGYFLRMPPKPVLPPVFPETAV